MNASAWENSFQVGEGSGNAVLLGTLKYPFQIERQVDVFGITYH
jgi:hypothetical protein